MRRVGLAGAGEHDPGAPRERLGGAAPARPALERRALLGREVEPGGRMGAAPKLDAKGEAHPVALACSKPHDGRAVWTMQLLADKLVELHVIADTSDETVRRTPGKNRLKPW